MWWAYFNCVLRLAYTTLDIARLRGKWVICNFRFDLLDARIRHHHGMKCYFSFGFICSNGSLARYISLLFISFSVCCLLFVFWNATHALHLIVCACKSIYRNEMMCEICFVLFLEVCLGLVERLVHSLEKFLRYNWTVVIYRPLWSCECVVECIKLNEWLIKNKNSQQRRRESNIYAISLSPGWKSFVLTGGHEIAWIFDRSFTMFIFCFVFG